MTTTAQSPHKLANLRDVAMAVPGIAAGVLLRSDAPQHADTHDGYSVDWPPKTVLDLRDDAERVGGHPFESSAAVVHLPLLGGHAHNPTEMPSSLGELYVQMLEGPAASLLVDGVRAMATSPTPVLVHCAAGKDRTGVTVGLALLLLGVEREHIVADYVLTAKAMDGVLARLANLYSSLGQVAEEAEPAPARRDLIGAPAEAIIAVLDAFESYDGDATGWYLSHGGDTETIAALRTRMLVNG